jgi:hypothetical protein
MITFGAYLYYLTFLLHVVSMSELKYALVHALDEQIASLNVGCKTTACRIFFRDATVRVLYCRDSLLRGALEGSALGCSLAARLVVPLARSLCSFHPWPDDCIILQHQVIVCPIWTAFISCALPVCKCDKHRPGPFKEGPHSKSSISFPWCR